MEASKKHAIRHFIWVLAIILFGAISVFLVTEAVARAASSLERFEGESIEIAGQEESPSDKYYVVGASEQPVVDAEGYVVADLETGQILLSHNANKIFPIASVTKLMTAVIAQEKLPQSASTIISKQTLATEGWRGQLELGQEIGISDLLYPLLLVSSNDAGEALARFQGRDRFILSMNNKAAELELENTNFDDPTGLSEKNVSTAEDLFKFLYYLARNEKDILKISRRDYYSIDKQVWENSSKLLEEETFIGGKTGFTYAAKQTGAGLYNAPLFDNNTRVLGIVILQSDDREGDIRKILEYVETYLLFGDEETLADLHLSRS